MLKYYDIQQKIITDNADGQLKLLPLLLLLLLLLLETNVIMVA